ncbi:hypothetical protein GGI1_01888, partial [Acidithiobacillus sp. GGI-221]
MVKGDFMLRKSLVVLLACTVGGIAPVLSAAAVTVAAPTTSSDGAPAVGSTPEATINTLDGVLLKSMQG